MTERPFSCTHTHGVLTVEGAVDESGIMALRNALEDHSDGYTARLVVDLSEVDYLPSVAVGVLTRAMGKLQRAGAELVLVARPGSMAQRVLMITALPHQHTREVAMPTDDTGLGA